jgi:G:T-mismatch repair DNA endonuclease (very short patch repair protein)
MIKEKKILVKGHSRNIKYYKEKGYEIEVAKYVLVNTSDLMKGSSFKITAICSNCSKEKKTIFKDYYISSNSLTELYYCNSCKYIKSEKTSLIRYGVSNPMKDDNIKEKLKNTFLEKYGVDHYSKTDEYKEKFKNTSLENWGVENPYSSTSIKEKIKQINKEKIGVEYPMQSLEVRKKSKQTCNNKWGKNQYSETNEFKEKINKITEKKFFKLLEAEYSVMSYKNEEFEILHHVCGNKFTTHKGMVYTRYRTNKIICTNCNPINMKNSSIELEVRDFLNKNNIQHLYNVRNVIGKELDIFSPEYNIAIEVNGIYWHSELYKPSKYHIEKTTACNSNKVQLIHIWEDDWINKNHIVKSILLNRFKLIKNKIYARNCDIELINSKEAKEFLNKNHIQGYSSSSIKLGLKYKGELVSLMTFGWRYTNGKKEYELIRFCNKINTNVIGSASKLFKYFLKSNKEMDIISYADISIFNGNIYHQLGFKKVSLSKPNYFWVVDNIRRHRFNFTKSKLVKKGHDSSKSEVEIMHSLGYYRIFSTGQEKWIYYKK